MAIPARLIKNVSFTPEAHPRYSGAPYDTDWDTGVKTVGPRHFTVTEGGTVWLTATGMKEPHVRNQIYDAIGHQVLLAADLPKVYDPVTKEVVTKKSINSDHTFIIEPDTCRVFCLSQYSCGQNGGYAMWVDPRGPITVFGEVKTLQRDVKAEKLWLEANDALVRKARGVCALEEIRRGNVRIAQGAIKAAPTDPNIHQQLAHLGWALDNAKEEFFAGVTSRRIEYKYLLTDPSKY